MKTNGKALISRWAVTLCESSRIAFRFVIVKKQPVRRVYKLKSRVALFKNSDFGLKAELRYLQIAILA
jgi:hypothetical protein